MNFWDLIKNRKSIRAYKPDPIDMEKYCDVIFGMLMAPSAGNLQAYKVFVVRDAQKRAEIAEAAYNQTFLAQAPIVFVFCADPEQSGKKYGDRGISLYSIQDATIAAAYAQLAATETGLATCWVGAFDAKKVSAIINVDMYFHPVILMALGYADEDPEKPWRRPAAEMIIKV